MKKKKNKGKKRKTWKEIEKENEYEQKTREKKEGPMGYELRRPKNIFFPKSLNGKS